MSASIEPLLSVENLRTSFFTQAGTVKAVQDTSFVVRPGEILGIVGESGCGKTTAGLSVMGLVPYPGSVVGGRILFRGTNLDEMDEDDRRIMRGEAMAMIFQDPQAALNPLITIGNQIAEIFNAHGRVDADEVREQTLVALSSLGLPDPEHVMQSYPWELSGGMCQRVMLAMMLVLEPELLIADEPTSALDVTLQSEILDRIMGLAKDSGTAVILITHDMGVLARAADNVIVMYGGRIVESADTVTLFHNPKHPYTAALLNAIPRLDRDMRPLRGIPGAPPDLLDAPDECPFLPRCNKATVVCRTNPMPPRVTIGEGHTLACYNPLTEGRTS
ncbi:MAG: ABC transporter ATP-binding protein [Chloroflexi bacterium]|nr:ABC transporter ATP-binding protein [Chloroflexota bacterium]